MANYFSNTSISKYLLALTASFILPTAAFGQLAQIDGKMNADNDFLVAFGYGGAPTGIAVNTGASSSYKFDEVREFLFKVDRSKLDACQINVITWGDGAVYEGFAGMLMGDADYVYTGGPNSKGFKGYKTNIPHNGNAPSWSQIQTIIASVPSNISNALSIEQVLSNGQWGAISGYLNSDFDNNGIPSNFSWVKPQGAGPRTQTYYVFRTDCGNLVRGPAPSLEKGMTFGLRDPYPNAVNGVVHVGCGDKDGVNCDAIKGDTLCTTPKPLLCINPMGLSKPDNVIESSWDRWSGGIVGTTKPMPAPAALSAANAACQAEFDSDWRVAQFHDVRVGRSGWSFSAYGNVGTQDKRFWTDIDDQPNGVCWDRNQ